MKGQMRKSGIDIIGDVPWGTHICQFYHTKEDLFDILIPYFKAGLENNEFCMWITSQPVEVKDAEEALRKAIPDFNTYLEKGQIEIIPYTDWFIKEGVFDSKRVSNSRFEKLNHALDSGYDGVRLSGNTTWLEKENWNSFIRFKEETDKNMDTYKMINLCTYLLDRCNATEIIDVVVNHQFALIKREEKWESIESPKRKKAEETAIQATKNWEYTFDAVPDLIAILDTQYRIVRANKAMAAKLGITPEDCVGLTCYRTIHGTEEPPSFCPYRQLLMDKLEHTWEVHEDSLGGDFIVSVSPLHDSKGELTGCIHVARDIAERKRAEDALRESEDRLCFALEISHTGAWDLDLMDHTAHRSLEHDRIFGYEQLLPQWTYEMFLDHVLPQDRAMVDAKFREATTTRSDWSFECRIRRVDSAVRWIWAAGRHRVDATGSVRRIAGIVQDITERKQLEEQTRQRAEEIETIMEVAPVAIWIGHDLQCQIITGNRMANEVYEAEFGENVSANVTPVRRFFRKGCELTADELPMQVAALKDVDVRNAEFDVLLPSGEWRGLLGSASPLHDADGRVRGSVGTFIDITERKKAEEALRESEARLQVIIANSPDIIFEQDRDLRYVWVFNPTPPYSVSDVVGKTDAELMPAEQAQLLTSIKRRVLDTGKREQAVLLLTHGEESRWFETIYEPRYDTAGQVTGILSYTRDITESKEAERALQESEKRFRTLAENSPDLIARFDRQKRHIYVNPANAEPYGFTPEEIIGKTNGQLGMSPELIKLWEEHYENVFNTGKPETMEFRYTSPQGKEYYFNTQVVPECVDGKVTSVLAISHDITGIKETEAKLKDALDNLENLVKERTEELERAYKLLKESEKGLSEAQKMARLGSWDWNLTTGELYWSDEKYRIFGYSPQEFIPTYNTFLSYIHPEDQDCVKNAITEALNGKAYSIDYRIIRVSGEERVVHGQGEATFDEKHMPVRIRGTIQDITERKKTEEMLKESEDKLKTLFKLLPVGVSIIDKKRKFLDTNLALERILGLSREDLSNRNYRAQKYLRSDGTEMPFEEFPSVRALEKKGSVQSCEIGIVRENGSIIWTDVSATVLPFSDGQVVITTRDITESKKAKEKLQKAEEKYRIVTEQTGQLVYDYDVEKDIADLAGNIEEVTGFTPDELGNINLNFWISRIHPEDLNRFLENHKKQYGSDGSAHRIEYRFRKKSEEYIYLEDSWICLRDGKSNTNRILGVIKNITERKKSEIILANIETARKKEIHHRIKNNLQVISSLLDLQAEKFRDRKSVGDFEVLNAFRESQDRVISIALIHEELHEGKGIDKLNFSQYLQRLIENLFQTYTLGNIDINLNMSLEENVFFDMDTAVPLGLIVNELVSNSLKYAFLDRDKGIIQIMLSREKSWRPVSSRQENEEEGHKNTSFVLTVLDDGVSIPESFDMENSGTLGIQLVTALVDQLDGTLELKRESGTEFIIRFAISEKK